MIFSWLSTYFYPNLINNPYKNPLKTIKISQFQLPKSQKNHFQSFSPLKKARTTQPAAISSAAPTSAPRLPPEPEARKFWGIHGFLEPNNKKQQETTTRNNNNNSLVKVWQKSRKVNLFVFNRKIIKANGWFSSVPCLISQGQSLMHSYIDIFDEPMIDGHGLWTLKKKYIKKKKTVGQHPQLEKLSRISQAYAPDVTSFIACHLATFAARRTVKPYNS